MADLVPVDVTFDLRSDTPSGKDPDTYSPTLRRYHQLLWSKPLPSGEMFDLDATEPRRYLHHKSDLGEFFLSSDTIIRTFRNHAKASKLMRLIPEVEQEAFSREGYTIGAMIVFPGNRVGNKQTINQRRGTHPKIADRFDLTLECIRRFYVNETSPLSETLELYASFFALFGSFESYIRFFLLQDLVSADSGEIKFFSPFQQFGTAPIPSTIDEYVSYRQLSLDFVRARNSRIAETMAH